MAKIKRLHLDIETFSSNSIENGVYKYSEAEDFDILLVAYKCDDRPTAIIDLASGEPFPDWLLFSLVNPQITKCAHNAQFERVCLSRYLRRTGALRQDEWLSASGWECSMILCQRCGIPPSLKEAGAYLGLTEQKMSEGKDLIKVFCMPQGAGASLFGESPRILPQGRPDDWQTFKDYCVRDVDVEYGIAKALSWYKTTDFEKKLYAVDQRINDRGVRIDRSLAQNAARIDAAHKVKLNQEAVAITGLNNPNSVSQLKAWMEEQTGEAVPTLRKQNIADMKEGANEKVQRVLQIRAEMGKTSVTKYPKMLEAACSDDRVRGVQLFCGTRTGRWAGRLLQTQNLPQNHLRSLDFARRTLMEGDAELMSLVYGNIPDTLSQLVRTALIPSDGKCIGVCDYSAVEARITAWLAGEEWVLDVFRKGGDIYCETASMMFKVPVEKHGRNAELRQKGKIAVLALGYQGWVGALEAMGGSRMGLSAEEEQEICQKYRDANPNIANLWKRLEAAVTETVIAGPGAKKTFKRKQYDPARAALNELATEGSGYSNRFNLEGGELVLRMEGTTLTIELPSGRKICYPKAQVVSKAGRPQIRFWGLAEDKDSGKKTKTWCWVETYGGKLTENVVQAIGRDCLAEAMVRAENAGIPVVFHVHDELVTELEDEAQLQTLKDCFSVVPDWAPGLPLVGAGYTGQYYFKD